MLMKFGFVFTNYNNSIFTRKAVESIYAGRKSQNAYIVIVDNKSEDDDVSSLKQLESEYPCIKVIFNDENIGYFSGLNVGIEYLRGRFPDMEIIVVGNNDLIFPANFLESLQNYEYFDRYGVLAPDIINMDGEHQNPHVISNISAARELVWDLYYFTYTLAVLITYMAAITKRLTQRRDFQQFDIPRRVAQGYGACYILGPLFFQHFEILWAPTFLMGEEFFLTEQLNRRGLYVFYDPRLKLHHHDHATMGKLPGKESWKHAKEAHRIYRQFVRPFWFFGSKLRLDVPEGK